jgi:protein involved in polysaccharide export with SLBB domain
MKKIILIMTGQTIRWLSLVVMMGWLVAGCQTPDDKNKFSAIADDGSSSTTNAAQITAPESGAEIGGRFAIGDLVRVTFSGITDAIQPHEERIKDDGTITLPLIGAIKAEGKTAGELQKAITDAYVPDYYKRLTITVSSDQRVYYVGGQVRNPGRQLYSGTTTVTKAIQSASDFTDFADRKNVRLTRADGKILTVDCIKAARDPALDPLVFPGDKIEVRIRGPFGL